MAYLLVGNYGSGNMGDEELAQYFSRTFPEVAWKVISARPEGSELPRLPCGIRSLLVTPWWKTVRELRRSDGLVFGGGSLFIDSESLRACILWFLHAATALLLRKPVILAFQGIGPFRTNLGRSLSAFVVRRAAFLSVRDASSLMEAEAMLSSHGLSTEVIHSFDPLFSLLSKEGEPAVAPLSGAEEGCLTLIPRQNSGEEFLRLALALFARGNFTRATILSLQPRSSLEKCFCRKLTEVLPKGKVPIIPITSLQELIREVQNCSHVLSERYHGALAALMLRKELTISPRIKGDKLSSLEREAPASLLLERVRRGEDALREFLSSHHGY